MPAYFTPMVVTLIQQNRWTMMSYLMSPFPQRQAACHAPIGINTAVEARQPGYRTIEKPIKRKTL